MMKARKRRRAEMLAKIAASKQNAERRRLEYLQRLDEMTGLIEAVRAGLHACIRSTDIEVPVRLCYDLTMKAYETYDHRRRYRRACGRIRRRRRYRQIKFAFCRSGAK